MEEKLSDKIIGNAITAYLMVFISGLFLFNKNNKNINNDFVKWHTKSAILIHLWFLITYIIFISNAVFSGINLMWFWLNNLIAAIICSILLTLLVIWIYKAKNGLEFNISKNISISKKEAILDIDHDWEITEKEKLTILLSFVPIIWFLSFAKYKENQTIENSTRLNITVSLVITLFYIFWYNNLSNLLFLIYIILVTFIWVNLFARSELIQVKLPNIFSPKNAYIWIITVKNYLKSYFKNSDFKDFTSSYTEVSQKIKSQNDLDEKELSTKKDLKIHKALIYIPFINLMFIFFRNTKYSFHIINGLVITFLLIISSILASYWYINPKLSLILLFPILFWISYSQNTLAYRIPIIYDIYEFVSKIFSFLRFWTKKINEKRKEKNELNLRVKK